MSHEYKVGDVVEHISGWSALIVERLTQECHGGTQYKYLVRIWSKHSVQTSLVEIAHIEVRRPLATNMLTAMECLLKAKELFVIEGNFDKASKVRDMLDAIKKVIDGMASNVGSAEEGLNWKSYKEGE